MWWRKMFKRLRKLWESRETHKPRRRPTVRPWLEPLEDRFVPAIRTWQAAAGGAWDVPTNWSGNAVPGLSDEAVFDPAVANSNVNSGAVNAVVGKLTIKSGYSATITLKSLTVGATGANETDTIQGGTISIASDGHVEFKTGTVNWSAGTISSSFTQPPVGTDTPPPFQVDADATVNLTGSANFSGNLDLDNHGMMTVSTATNIIVGNGSQVLNFKNAVIDVQSDIAFVGTPYHGRGQFDNAGTFKKTAGTGSTRLDMPFNNEVANAGDPLPLFQVKTGTINLAASGTQTAGTTEIYAGATLQVFNTYVVDAGTLKGNGAGTSTITGNLTLNGGDFYVGTDGTIATFRVSNNYTQNGGTLHIDVDGNQTQKSDLLDVGNTATLGGNLTVNTLNGNKPANAFKILTYLSRVNDFTSFTYLGGATYTPDPKMTEYDLKP